MKILQKISAGWQQFQAGICRCFGKNYQCKCGHTCKRKTILTIDGHQGVFEIPNKTPEYCPECWQKAAIKCAWCGHTILPGDPITLYSPKEGFEIPEYAVVYKREPRLQLVGCLGWDCAHSGVDRVGFWVMPGKVQRVASPLEMLIARGGEGALIVNDLSDPSQTVPISDEVPD